MSEKQSRYLQKKQRELTDWENAAIRERIQQGESNVYELAAEFGCVPVQVAGLKAAITKGR